MNSKLNILFFCIWSISSFAMQEVAEESSDVFEVENFLGIIKRVDIKQLNCLGDFLSSFKYSRIPDRALDRFFELLEPGRINTHIYSDLYTAIFYKQEKCAICILDTILRKNRKQIIFKNKDSGISLGLSPGILALVVENDLFELAEILSVHFTNSELKTLWFCIENHLKQNPSAFQNWENLIKKILIDRILIKGSIEEFKEIVLNIFDFAILHESFDIIALFADKDILKFLLEIDRDLITKLLIKQKFKVLKTLRTQNPDLYELKDAYNNTTLLHLAQSCLDANAIQINTIRKAFNFLTSQKVDLNAKNCYGKNVLDILTDIQGGSDNLRASIDIFLRLGIKTSSVLGLRNKQKSKIDKTEFTRIFESGNLEEIEKFIKTRSDEIFPVDWDNLLQYPTSENVNIARRWFVENKIHLNYRTKNLNHNLLEIALLNNDWDFVDLLISNDPSLFEKCNFDFFLDPFFPKNIQEEILNFNPVVELCKRTPTQNISKLFCRFATAPDKELIESLRRLGVDFSFKGDFGLNLLEKDLREIFHNQSLIDYDGLITKNVYYQIRNGLVVENKYLLADQNYIKIYNKFQKYVELAEQFRAFLDFNNGQLSVDHLNIENMYPPTEKINQEKANQLVNDYKIILVNLARNFVELGEHIIIPACFVNNCPLIKYLPMNKKLRLVILIENTIQEDFLKEILLAALLHRNENN